MNVYLDTCAVIKLYHQEAGSKELLALLNSHAHDLILTISDITRTEFHSAFLRRVRMNEIAITAAQAVLDAFDNDLHMFNQVSVDSTVKSMATSLIDNVAHKRNLRTLDAFQLASALFCHQLVPVDFFITFDHCLASAAKDYFAVFNCEVNG
jgi:predicted nucleic acid-binding protein